MKPNALITVVLAFVLAACSPAGGEQLGGQVGASMATSAPGAAAGGPVNAGAPGSANWHDSSALGVYTATFTAEFSGAAPWKYVLVTRVKPGLREQNLHIEGVDAKANPGDVRIVSDAATIWMIGPGTDNACVRFQTGQGLDPTMLTPETLFQVDALAALLQPTGEENVIGRPAQRLTSGGGAAGGWQVSRASMLQDTATGALLSLDVQASGEDVIFGTGTGTLTARYSVDDLSEPEIAVVEGCETGLPLPDAVSKYVQLPGLESFESDRSADEVAYFYQVRLPQEGWGENELAERSNSAIVLSYRRDTLVVDIQIEPREDGGCKVKALSRVVE